MLLGNILRYRIISVISDISIFFKYSAILFSEISDIDISAKYRKCPIFSIFCHPDISMSILDFEVLRDSKSSNNCSLSLKFFFLL